MQNKVMPGYNFLHNHPGMERKLDLNSDHVIIDRLDWEIVLEWLSAPEMTEAINKAINEKIHRN